MEKGIDKSAQRALEAYPVKEEWVGNQYGGPEDVNKISREKYIEGYHQAEKDLELTWEDIERIDNILIRIRLDGTEEAKEMSYKEFYQEVLKRFKDFKEREGI